MFEDKPPKVEPVEAEVEETVTSLKNTDFMLVLDNHRRS